MEWEVRQLGEVSDFVTSGARGWARYYREDGAIFLRIGNLTRQHINLRFDDIVFVQPPESAEGQRTRVMCGDILISVTADLGIIGVIPEGFEEAFVNQHIALVRPDGETVDSRFVGWFFSSRMGQVQFEQRNESGAKAGLNLPTIRRLEFPSPKLSEQRLISDRLDSCVSVLNLHSREQNKLRSLKTALMQDILTGKRRVTALLNDAKVAAV
jgi:type I restriction enzyme S subunit